VKIDPTMAEVAIPGVVVRLEKAQRTPLETKIVAVQASGKRLLWALAALTDRTTAQAWAGAAVCVARAAIPAAGDDEHFDFELLGATVSDSDGTPLGVVREILPTGANDVLVAHGPRGEVLIPATRFAIREIDRNARRIIVDGRALVYEDEGKES
jgi:16S rRNA processing protein RimM